MRIAITGSYGAGKTTLVRALSRRLGRPVAVVPPMSGPIWSESRPAPECSRPELLELLVRRMMDRSAVEFHRREVVSDGSLIHDWVFVRTLLMHGPDPGPDIAADAAWLIESIEPARRAIHSRMRDLYDVVVHLPIEFGLGTGHQPVSEEFRRLSDVYLLHELDCAALQFRTVTGPLEDRVAQCLELADPRTADTNQRSP